MSRVFSSDVTHSIQFEGATYGVIPTTGTRYALPLSADQAPLTAEASEIKDNTLYPNRAGGGSQRGMVSVSGSLNQRMVFAPVVDHLLESALSGTFTGGTLVGGTTDSSFTLFTRFGAAGYKAYSGLMCKGFTIDAKANDALNIDWQVVGTGYTSDQSTAVPAVTTTTGYSAGYHLYDGSDVKNITIGGVSVPYSEVSFASTVDRTMAPVLGSKVGLQPGVNGTRQTTVTIKAYRNDMTIDAALTGAAQAFSFDVGGTTGSVYHFSTPGMIFSIATDELNNGSAFVNIKGMASYDGTLNSDLSVTKA